MKRVFARSNALPVLTVFLVLCGQAVAALDVATVFECRQTGLDTNAGGFTLGAAIAAPAAPTVTPSGSGGTVLAGTYYVVVTYTDAVGNTVISGETAVTVSGATASFTVESPPAVTGAITWSNYCGVVTGGPYFPQGTGLTIGSNRIVTTTPPVTGTQPNGVDYSQQDSPQINVADGVANGTTLFTSATAGFTGAHVGNLIRVGTSTWRRIVGIVSATNITLDATVATNTSLPVVVGGAFLTPGMFGAALPQTGSQGALKYSATIYTMSASTNVAGGSLAIPTTDFQLFGYNTTRTPWNRDTLRPTIKPTANSTTMVTLSGGNHGINNIAFTNPDNKTSCTAFNMESSKVINCKISGYATFQADGAFCIYAFNDISCTSTVNTGSYTHMIFCDVHDGAGVSLGISASISFANVYNITATIYAIRAQNNGGSVFNCNVYHQTNDSAAEVSGIHLGAGQCIAVNCIVEDVNPSTNTGYAFKGSGNAIQAAAVQFTNCFYFNIKTAPADPANTVPLNLYGCTLLSSSPFTAPGSGNFALNNTTNAGKTVRAAALPTTFPAGTTANYLDAGAVQHIDPTAGGFIPGPMMSPRGPTKLLPVAEPRRKAG